MALLEEILRCPSCGFLIRGSPSQYLTRRAVLCPMCRAEVPLTGEDRLRLKRLAAKGAGPDAAAPPPGPAHPPRGGDEPGTRRPRAAAPRSRPGGVPPSTTRRPPRFPARLAAWWAAQRGAQRLPAETVNVSSTGLLLVLADLPAPGTSIQVRVETPFGLVKGEGCIAWTEGKGEERRAGVALTQLHGPDDRVRWESLIGQLAARVAPPVGKPPAGRGTGTRERQGS